jgi:hypothetical protein
MHPEVTWPNGWEGGWVEGIEGVRHYWRRQWAALDPHVEPRAFKREADGRITVSVHQVVRDLTGAVLADRMVEHVYQLQDGYDSISTDQAAPLGSCEATREGTYRRATEEGQSVSSTPPAG